MGEVIGFSPKSGRSHPVQGRFGANKGEVVPFVSKPERERARLIREARAIYDSIFPSADAAGARRDVARLTHMASSANTNRSDGIPLS